jgi:predicted  nucleic acid-binding Zn-ribbon protein
MKTKNKKKSRPVKKKQSPRRNKRVEKKVSEAAELATAIRAAEPFTVDKDMKGNRAFYTVKCKGEVTVEIAVPRILNRTEIVVNNHRIL